ncbi:putative flippase GtrA [Amorphus suaedae]
MKQAQGVAARCHQTVRALIIRHQRLVRFLLVGVVNTIFGYSVFALLYLLTHHHNFSVIAATIIGIIFNFFTTGRIVFGNKSLRALLPFIMAYGVALALNLVVLNLLLAVGISALIGQAISLPVVVIVSYLINARFVFRDPTDYGASKHP